MFPLTKSVLDNNPLPASGPAELITYDLDGCPILPGIDLVKSTVEDIRQILITYLNKQWGTFQAYRFMRTPA